jgi:pantothenate kinase type III
VAAGIPLLDLGNQRLKLARSTGPGQVDLIASVRLQELQAEQGVQWLSDELRRFDRPAFVCSTRPDLLQAWLVEPRLAELLLVLQKEQLPLDVQTTGTGMDRLLASLAAWRLSNRAVLVADLGTAWTLDATTAQGVFLGGAIGLGLGSQDRALQEACPHLHLPADQPCSGIPNNTSDAVAEGSRTALALALDALAWAYEQDLEGGAQRYLCGGDARAIAPWMSADWTYADHLVLQGMAWLAHDIRL